MSAADFDAWVSAHDVPAGETASAFADWLAQQTGGPVLVEDVDGEMIGIAIPDEEA